MFISPEHSQSATASFRMTLHPDTMATRVSSLSVRFCILLSLVFVRTCVLSRIPYQGEWPITLGRTTTSHMVYLSEESHFDIVLGRSFMERRSVKTDTLDLTSVHCMDTGEKVDCEVVIIRDGKGEYVTVT
jgi:hypothetical protein